MASNEQPISIRRATVADVETLAFFSSQVAIEAENLVLDLDIVRRGCEAVVTDANKGRYYVAHTDDGTLVGQIFVTFEWSDWHDTQHWWLQSVFVRADYRRRGTFRLLFAHIEEEAKREGAVAIKLYAYKDNTRAHAAYLALGMVSDQIVFETKLEQH